MTEEQLDNLPDGYYVILINEEPNTSRQIAEKVGTQWYPNGCEYMPWTWDQIQPIARIDISSHTFTNVSYTDDQTRQR